MKQARIAILIGAIICCGIMFFTLRSRSANEDALPVGRAELMLYCGAGIRPAADALIEAFEARHRIKINTTYAGGGRLLGEIATLQTGDLFMPGAEWYVDRAIEKGLAIRETKRIVAFFVPVIFVRKGNPHNIASLQDLTRKGLRLGFGDERSCAVGKKTLRILEKNDIPYSDVKANVLYKSGTVNELGLAIQLENVDAVILWDANARHFAEHGQVVAIPKEQNVLSPIPAVVLKSSRHPAAAGKFIDFITSDEGRGIFSERGYSVSAPSDKQHASD